MKFERNNELGICPLPHQHNINNILMGSQLVMLFTKAALAEFARLVN